MSRFSALSVENGKHIGAKMGGITALIAAEFASDYTVISYKLAETLRTIGKSPYDVFNHTGNMWIGLVAGMFGSYVTTGAQTLTSKIRGTTETASPTRMNRISSAAGLLATAAASYGFEKLGGSVDMLDVWYSLGSGACASSLIRVERKAQASPMEDGTGELPPALPVQQPGTLTEQSSEGRIVPPSLPAM
ncbi:MAG TPA: hypothetical protein VJ836_05150 [Candidatus Saccharimonadales bacterium]|nr:hypothetical protein [Candidatus Saccharimonadales bacterium]